MEYIPNTADDHRAMLATIGVERFDDLLKEIPASVRLSRPLAVPPALTELEVRREIGGLLDRNVHADRHACFLGAGAYDHAIPSIVPSPSESCSASGIPSWFASGPKNSV